MAVKQTFPLVDGNIGQGRRPGQISSVERALLLRAFDELMPRISVRKLGKVRAEIAELRRARRSGGRLSGEDASFA